METPKDAVQEFNVWQHPMFQGELEKAFGNVSITVWAPNAYEAQKLVEAAQREKRKDGDMCRAFEVTKTGRVEKGMNPRIVDGNGKVRMGRNQCLKRMCSIFREAA